MIFIDAPAAYMRKLKISW